MTTTLSPEAGKPLRQTHPRIVVVGTSGSGKTTLAKQLAAARGLEHIELDVLYHGPNWSVRDDFNARVSELIARHSWVCDGNYTHVRQTVWARATTFVWLDYSLPRTFARGLARTARRVASRDEVFPGCRETFGSAFLSSEGIPAWILRTHYRHRQTYLRLFASRSFREVPVYRLRSPSQTRDFLARL